MKESSRYEYEINIEDKNTTVVKQLNFIGINKKVLEFGCSTGYISKILKEKGCAITGIEIDEEASKKAAAYCERVIIGDIETIDYNKQLGNEKFDVALFGDILEHLKYPKTILLKVKDFLKEKGYIVISIPNVAHWSVRLDLTCGKFDYQDSGILDDTHLRFFTKSSIINLLESCGYYMTSMDEVRQEVDWNKVGTVMRLKNLNDADLKNFSSLLNDTEAGVFQYVLKAAPSSDLEHLKKISAEKINLEERIQIFEGQITAFSGQLTDKERQINALTATIQGKDEQIKILDGQITNISGQHKEKDKQIDVLNVAAQGKEEQLRALGEQITDFSSQLTEKDKQIEELNVAVQGKEEQLRALGEQITDFSDQLKEKEQQIEELNVAVREKDTQLRNFNELKTTISSYIKEKDKQIDELDITIQESDEQIRDLEEQITDISGRQKEKEQRITELNIALQGKDKQILNLDGQIANISGQRKEREERLGEMGMQNLRIDCELNSMKSSVTWRIVMKWHSFVDEVLPQGTNKRRWYDQRLIRLRTSANEDGRISSGNEKEHRASKEIFQSSAKSTKTEAPKFDIHSEDLEKIQNIYNAKYGGDFISDIDKRDEMYQFLVNEPSVNDPIAEYFYSGELLLTGLQEVFEDLGYSFNQIDTFLDFACGYGRFTRFLIQKLDHEKITVSDIDKNAVDFVKSTFGVNGFYSVDNPDRLIHDTRYDVIFVASLFSHLSLRFWCDWLKRLYDLLNDGGILIFSTHGVDLIKLLNDEMKVLVQKVEEGFYYVPLSETKRLSTKDYGSTYVRYDYAGKVIRQNNIGKIVAYYPKKLHNFQDIYVIKKDVTKIMFDDSSQNGRHVTLPPPEKEDGIKELGNALAQKDKLLRELAARLEDKNQHILHIEGEVTEITNAIVQREEKIREIEMDNRRINSEFDSIKQSATWRTVMKWHSFVEKSIPQRTRRRRYYDLSLIGLRTITNDGWSSFWWKYKQHKSSKKHTELIAKSAEERILETATEITELPEKSLDTFKSYKLLNLLSQPGVNLSFPKSDEPVVSIITLTFNKAEFTYQYLESILAHTDIPYELIIVDNGSQDETTSLLDRLENVTTIKNEGNLGFIKGCNQGASKARGKYLVFLNNDIIVTPEWLSKLVKTIERYPKCGAVGCKLIWPNGKLQEAGSIIWNDGSALGYGREGDPMHPEYSYLREVDYCSGACLLVRKDIFQQLGEFDERYIPAYYEDSDLCLGIWELGYKVVFQADVAVFHNEFTSSSINKATAIMAANQSKFVAKRKDTLKDKFNPSPNNVLFARDLRQGDRMLVIDDRVPTPYQGSGYPRAYHMLNFLGELGYKVTFFPLDNATPWQPYTNELQQLGIEVFYGDNLDFIRFAQDRAGYYDLVLVSRPHNMEMAVDAVKRFFSNAVLLYDAEALFSMRAILKAKVKGIKLRAKDAERMINGEMDLLNKADLIITVSENEKKMIVERGNLNNIAVWGHPIDVKSPKNDFHERKDILFVGGFLASESPNEDAVLYFAKEVFPKLRKEISCRFFIAGINPPDSIKKLSSSSVIVTGYVEDLREYYEKCRIFIVPHRYSAGIPWKLQEAMSYGIPSVVSELTASQLDLTDGNEVLVAKSSDEFVQKIIKLYQDEKLWYTVQRNAVEYIQKTCKSEVIKNSLHKIIMKGLQIKTKP